MTTYYVGQGGNDGNNGQTWALRKLTLNGAEDIPVAAGDVVYVGPGAYRELLTCDVSGGNTYSTGTVSVTNGSDQVTGNGTAWVANVGADYLFHVRYYDNGNDMVTDGSNNVTAAGGNFQAAMEGRPIQINTKGAYVIDTVNAADDIDISDPNGLGWPAAGAGLTYSVMSAEGHYEIESVDDNTTITLKQTWQGRTLTGLAYLTFEPITYIGDVTGESTNDVGGVVRITGSDNDQTAARASCIDVSGEDYRVFRGFSLDSTTSDLVDENGSATTHIIIEDCVGHGSRYFINPTNAGTICWTLRRIKAFGMWYVFYPIVTADDTGHVFENCNTLGAYTTYAGKMGGVTLYNCVCVGNNQGVRAYDLTTGQCVEVYNSVFCGCIQGVSAGALGMLIENFNTFFSNNTDRTNTGTGANSVSYTPVFNVPILHAGVDQLSGYRFPFLFGDLSEWSQLNLTGMDERNTDFYGIPRPATASKCSWGPIQFHDWELEDTTVQAGSYSRVLNDAGSYFRWVPVANESTTIACYVYREANYAGTNPQMIIRQPGQSDRTTTDAAAASQWNQLSDTFTPAATPGYVLVEVRSNNTAVAGNYKVYIDTFTVS